MNDGIFSNNDDRTIFVIDQQGNEVEMTVLFTVESTISHKNIVCYFDEKDPEGQVFASIYDDEGNLFAIEDEAEWDFIEEVFNTFVIDEEESEDEDEETIH